MLWKKNVKEIGGEEPDWGLSSTPIISDNMVIVQGGGKALVAAYNKENGDLIWKSLEGPSGYSASAVINVDSTKLLMVYHGKALSCLNPENGKEIWSVPWETEYGVNASTPAIENNILFHTSGYGKGGEALKLSKNGFKVLWKKPDFAAQHSDPIIIDGYIYGYSGESTNMNGEYKCLELTTGKEMWTSKEIGQGTSIYVDNYMICFDLKGNLYLSKPNTKGLNLISSFKSAMPEVTNPAWTAPVVANGKIYLRYMQKLICYNLMP